MRFSSSAVEVFLLIVTSSVVTSFVPDIGPNYLTRATKGDSGALFLSPDDLTNYMAKAHEEKLRAIKAVEEKKNDEIKVRIIAYPKLEWQSSICYSRYEW